MSRLGARYRLLLRAYPPGRRRGEILETLLEAAPAGRRRPTRRETVNLLRCGLRARLGRPASRSVIVFAVLAVLVTGFTTAAVAGRLAWETVPGYPAGAALEEISGTVFPGVRADAVRQGDGLFFDVSERSTAEVFLTGHDEDFAFSTLLLSPPGEFLAGEYPSWTQAAQGRLVRAGWQVEDAEVTGATLIATGEIDDTGRRFTATRDGLGLTVEAMTDVVGAPEGSFHVTATLDRLTPWYVHVLALLGLLAGGLTGWLLTGWVSRRTEGAGGAVRALTTTAGASALLLLLPSTALGYVVFVYQMIADGPPGKPFWTYSVTYGFGCGFLGVILLVVAMVTTVLKGRPDPERLLEG